MQSGVVTKGLPVLIVIQVFGRHELDASSVLAAGMGVMLTYVVL